MYSEAANQSMPMAEQTLIRPELEQIHDRLSKCNSENISLLCQVEDKLHKIWNKRSPEKESKPNGVPAINDFVGAVNEQLSYYESHNAFLLKILNHLSQIA